jgi:NAD(P)-dependent dehydrogenase (short-subunit alcohol dehydrogenase family)
MRVNELAGKTAFVTGAASGIGLGIVPTSGPFAKHINMLRENMVRARVSQGIDPSYAGELVREGVEKDWPYIFTDLEFEPMIEARFAAIKQGFEHIRGRNPKR